MMKKSKSIGKQRTNKRSWEQARQGDVLMIATERASCAGFEKVAPEKAPDGSERVVLAHGAVTGHSHAFLADRVSMFRDDGGGASTTYVEVKQLRSLKHEEHGPISTKPGIYEVRRQVEYTPEEIRRVED
jgi:hypothetical protein